MQAYHRFLAVAGSSIGCSTTVFLREAITCRGKLMTTFEKSVRETDRFEAVDLDALRYIVVERTTFKLRVGVYLRDRVPAPVGKAYFLDDAQALTLCSREQFKSLDGRIVLRRALS